MAGLFLDPWEEHILTESLGERADHKWAAFEVGVVVPRQNGKGSILEARELTGLFLLDERLLIHSAHQFDTSLEGFRRLLMLIEDTPDFDRRVYRVVKSHGEEGIELKKNPRTGLRQRIRFRTRTKGGGRGFTADWLGLDEAMILPETTVGALLPTLSARPNPQVMYAASAVDQEVHDEGVALARLRERALSRNDPSLAYFEHSVDAANPAEVTLAMAKDPERWAEANPGLGIRITTEHVAREQRSMDPRTFAVERLGVGDWPRTDGLEGVVITPEAWASRTDRESSALNPVCFALDVNPDRTAGAVGVAGLRTDRRSHVEIIEHKKGTGWIVPLAAELVLSHKPVGVVCDASGPIASLLSELADAGVEVTLVNAKEQAQACGLLYDAVDQDTLRHLGTRELTTAIAGAVKRPLGDAWAWSRKSSAVDISPLVAITLAHWGSQTLTPPKPEVIDLNELKAEMEADGEL
jgi:hypothetical protein